MAKIKKQRKFGDNGIVIATVIITLLFVISAGYLIGGDNLVSTVFQKESKGRTFYFITTDNFDDITIARQNANNTDDPVATKSYATGEFFAIPRNSSNVAARSRITREHPISAAVRIPAEL